MRFDLQSGRREMRLLSTDAATYLWSPADLGIEDILGGGMARRFYSAGAAVCLEPADGLMGERPARFRTDGLFTSGCGGRWAFLGIGGLLRCGSVFAWPSSAHLVSYLAKFTLAHGRLGATDGGCGVWFTAWNLRGAPRWAMVESALILLPRRCGVGGLGLAGLHCIPGQGAGCISQTGIALAIQVAMGIAWAETSRPLS